jgi:hypothetical protein
MSLYPSIQSIPDPLIAPSDNILFNNPTERYVQGTTVTKLKETRVCNMGKIRTYFEMRSAGTGNTAYGQVYKNGVAVGTLRSTTSTTYVSFTEDIDGWFGGDLYQIYGYALLSAGYCYVQNQQIRGVLIPRRPAGMAIL